MKTVVAVVAFLPESSTYSMRIAVLELVFSQPRIYVDLELLYFMMLTDLSNSFRERKKYNDTEEDKIRWSNL